MKEAQEKMNNDELAKVNFLALQSMESALEDSHTINAYMKAIKQSDHLFHGKTVLHLTTGCFCLYSIFAAQAGASKVYCVINGHGELDKKNIYMMKNIVKENGFEDIISILSFRYFNAEVDVIIGEPMGYNLFYDSMLDRIIEARDLYLKKKSGLIFPNVLKFKCCFIRDDHFTDKKVQFWNQVYGVPMSSMKKWISQEPVTRVVDPTLIVSEINKFAHFNLHEVTYEEIDNFSKNIGIKINQDETANGLSFWFQAQFTQGIQKVQIKASPWCETTRWTHMTLYNDCLWTLKGGEEKMVYMKGKKEHMEGYSMIKLKVQGKQVMYAFS